MDESQLKSLEKKIGALESEVFALRSELEKAKRGISPGAATAAIVQPAAKTKPAPVAEAVKVPAAPVNPPKAVPAAQPAAAASADAGFSWEWLIGGNIIGKIGIVTL